MFSGIVQCIGEVKAVVPLDGGSRNMTICTPLCLQRFSIGASVAHSGACMTVVSAKAVENGTEYDICVSPESLAKTTMSEWEAGTKINLETSLKIGDENGGHDMRGHVDGVAEILSIDSKGNSWDMRFGVDLSYMGFLPHKGSVGLDGMSLTVVDPNVTAGTFGVAVVPHTWQVTTLHLRKVGDKLNFEIDTFARYIATYLEHYMATKANS